MNLDKLYSTIETVELEKKYIFVVHTKSTQVLVDVRDFDDEEEIDFGWFDSVDEAIEFVSEFKGSL